MGFWELGTHRTVETIIKKKLGLKKAVLGVNEMFEVARAFNETVKATR